VIYCCAIICRHWCTCSRR